MSTVEQSNMFGGAEAVLVSARRLATVLDVSDQSIYNWADKGMPCVERPGKKGKGPEKQFNIEKCRAWVAANQKDYVEGNTKGGKRDGAGRKPAAASAKKAAETFVVKAAGAEPVQPVTMAGEQGNSQPAPQIPIKSAADLLSRMGDGTMQGVQSRNLRDQAAAVKTLQEVELRSGNVLQADQVEEAWAGHMNALKTRLESLKQRSTGAIAAELALTPEQSAQVLAVLERDIDSVCVMMAEDPMNSADGGGDEDVE